ncbi:mRNA cap guanine-N7 methyltransferase 1 [Tanacetum coccineum]
MLPRSTKSYLGRCLGYERSRSKLHYNLWISDGWHDNRVKTQTGSESATSTSKWELLEYGSWIRIEDCRTRYNGVAGPRCRKRFDFPARLYSGSCFDVRLDQALADDAPFDICSCQARARTALANVSSLLRPRGIFIGTMSDADVIVKRLRTADGLAFSNSVYRIQFDDEFPEVIFKSSSPFGIQYTFYLEDAIDCREWIVPFQAFKSLAEEYDLELVFVKNSHDFVHEYMKKRRFIELMRRHGVQWVMETETKVNFHYSADLSTLSIDEWEVAYLYLSYAFRKRGRPEQNRGNTRRNKGKMHLEKEYITHIS